MNNETLKQRNNFDVREILNHIELLKVLFELREIREESLSMFREPIVKVTSFI